MHLGKRSQVDLPVPEALRSRGEERFVEAGHTRIQLDASLIEQRPRRSACAYRLQVASITNWIAAASFSSILAPSSDSARAIASTVCEGVPAS